MTLLESSRKRAGRVSLELSDLRIPAGNRLEALKGDRTGQYSIRVNDQYRITFEYENGHSHTKRIKKHFSFIK